MGEDFNPVKFVVGGLLTAASFFVPGAGPAIMAVRAAMLTAGTALLQAGIVETPTGGVELELDNSTDTQNPLPVVYGGTILPLRIVDIRVDPNSPNRQDLWIVGALCHGSENGYGIEGIDKVWFDNVLAVDDTNTVQSFFAGYLGVQKYVGSDSQSVAEQAGSTYTSGFTQNLNAVFPDAWPTTSKGAGIACIVCRLTYNQQIYSGIPNITVSVRGNKVYDPRSASPRSTVANWSYSQNPALCVADYLLSARYGMKFATSEVDCGTAGSDSTSSFSLMAAFSEQSVTKPDTTTDWRFMCHGALDVAQAPTENLRRLLSSCRGAVFWEAGQARLAIRDVATPTTFGLDESVIVGDWTFRAPGVTDAPNIIRATYPDMAQNYRADTVQWPNPGASNSYLTADNGFESVVDIELPMTVERWRAEQIALVTLKEMRSALPMQVTCREAALQLRVSDVTPVTHSFPSWSAKGFWVTEMVFDPSSALVRIAAVAYDENAYDLDAQTQYPTPPATNLPDPTQIAPPTDVFLLCDSTTASRLPDGAMANRIKVTWTAPSDPFLNHYLFYGCKVGDSPRPLGLASAGDTEFFFGPVPSDELWQVQMSAVNGLGRESAVTAAETVGTPTLGGLPKDNMLLNGDGQDGELYTQATGWEFVSGAPLTIANDWCISGDRSLKMVNAGSQGWSRRTVSVVTGDVLHIYGYIKTAGGIAGYGVIQLTQAATATFTVLDARATYTASGGANNYYIGTNVADVEFVHLLVRITLGGTLYVNLRIDSGATGTVWWDDIHVKSAPPALTDGLQQTKTRHWAGSLITSSQAGLLSYDDYSRCWWGHTFFGVVTMPLDLAVGIRIKKVRARYYRQSSSETISAKLRKVTADTTTADVAVLNTSMTTYASWATVEITCDQPVAAGELYQMYFDYSPTAANYNGIAWVEIDQLTTSYVQTLG